MKSRMILVDGNWYSVSYIEGDSIFAMDEDGMEYEFYTDDIEMEK